jgi:hypothetical protein
MNFTNNSWPGVARTTFRVLTFRASEDEMINVGWRHLAFGLAWAWIAGIGRYWDNPRVGFWQHLGVGSVVYVFILALFLRLVIWPMRPRHWTYFRVVTFIAMVSPPALIYAIPVERFYSLYTANSINAVFLLIVAVWRVALLFWFLNRVGRLPWYVVFVGATLPLSLIVVALTLLNLEQVVFNLMGGITQPSGNDGAYDTLLYISLISVYLFFPLLIAYTTMAVIRITQARRDRKVSELVNESVPPNRSVA